MNNEPSLRLTVIKITDSVGFPVFFCTRFTLSTSVNAKRIYGLEGLTVRTKARKELASRARVPAVAPTRPNERWTMDFVSARTTIDVAQDLRGLAGADPHETKSQLSVPDSSPNRAIPFPRVVQVTTRPSVASAEKDDSIAPLVISELSRGSWNRAGG